MSQHLSITAYTKDQELKGFLEEMLLINQKLHKVALALEDEENIESQNSLLKTLSKTFDLSLTGLVATSESGVLSKTLW